MSASRRCDGPVYIGDQGIEACDTCGHGCLCCVHTPDIVDHSRARYWCACPPVAGAECVLDHEHGKRDADGLFVEAGGPLRTENK